MGTALVTPRCIMGVDPGLNTTGYGVIQVDGDQPRLLEAGTVRSRSGTGIEARVAAILMGHARGVVCLAAGLAGIELHHFEPTRVKKVMTGNGRAPKHQIQHAVRIQLGLPSVPEPPDVADALAIALVGFHLSANPLLNTSN